MYHGVVEQALDPFCWHMLPVDAFREQLRYVKRNYEVLPLGDALRHLADGTLPERSCAITFDDGFLNNRTVALPVLQELGLPATIFLVTGFVGTNKALWPDRVYLALQQTDAAWLDATHMDLGTLSLADARAKAEAVERVLTHCKRLPAPDKDAQLQQLLDALGIDPEPGPFTLMSWHDVGALAETGLIAFGGHTTRHDLLSRLHDAQVESEVRLSHAEVARRVGVTPTCFAYPNGRAEDFDARAKAAVKALSLHWAVSTENGLVDAQSDPLALPRMCIGSDLSLGRFKLLTSGAWNALRGP